MSTPCLNAIERAEGIYIYDAQGRKYMDFHGNSVHQIGYGNRELIEGLKAQLDTLAFVPRRYTNRVAVEAAKRLVDLTGGELSRVLFTPGGSLSIGLALKLARVATGRHKVVSMWDSFHGAGLDAISVGGERVFREGMGPLMSGVEHVMPYNAYRCVFGDCAGCGLRCLDYLEYVLEREGEVGAVLLEPIRATDVQVPPPEYFLRLRQLCDRHGALLIFDEVPTAFGRTGEFFVYQNFGVTPDILVLGKGIGGGIVPISAVLVKEGLNVAGNASLGHYTHEKSALGCRAILETVGYIERHDLLTHVRAMERVIAAELERLRAAHECVGDVRLKGMLFAIELVRDRATKEKAVAEAERSLYACLTRGLSFKVSGGNVLTMGPPIVATEDEIRAAFGIIEESLSLVEARPG